MSMSPEPEEECLPASCTAAARASRDRTARRERPRARTEPSRRNPRAARSAKNLFDRDAMAHNLNAVDGCRSYLTLFGAVGAGVVGATGLRGLLFFVGTYVLGSVALLPRMRFNPVDYTSESLTKFVITGARRRPRFNLRRSTRSFHPRRAGLRAIVRALLDARLCVSAYLLKKTLYNLRRAYRRVCRWRVRIRRRQACGAERRDVHE